MLRCGVCSTLEFFSNRVVDKLWNCWSFEQFFDEWEMVLLFVSFVESLFKRLMIIVIFFLSLFREISEKRRWSEITRVQDLFPINSCNFNLFPHELQSTSGCNAYEHVKNKLGQSIYLFLDAWIREYTNGCVFLRENPRIRLGTLAKFINLLKKFVLKGDKQGFLLFLNPGPKETDTQKLVDARCG